jgi:hypothetical protein
VSTYQLVSRVAGGDGDVVDHTKASGMVGLGVMSGGPDQGQTVAELPGDHAFD